MRSPLLPAAVFLLISFSRADVALAPVFSDHAVLQRDRSVPIWGWADPGEEVTVQFADQTAITRADDDGNWRVDLSPLPPRRQGAILQVRGHNEIHLRDILVGDVWLCGGQSNMEWQIEHSDNAAAEIAAGDHPFIRHLKVERHIAASPRSELQGHWTVCTSDTVKDYTAVGYFFARRLQQDLDVPIGLLNINWGGTPVEAWLPPLALQDPDVLVAAQSHQSVSHRHILTRFTRYREALSAWEVRRLAAEKAGEPVVEPKPVAPWHPGPAQSTSALYHGMIHPVVPYALRGFIWYQGEANADEPDKYALLFQALIKSWRTQFAHPAAPFYWAQLAAWDAGNGRGRDWAWLREAQHQALALPHTGQAILMDIGEAFDIHPRNKQDVGDRLARIALAETYQHPVAFRGPAPTEVSGRDGGIVVSLDHAHGLTTKDGEAPRGFEVAGADREFRPATTATISGPTVVLASDAVPQPAYVRYAWRRWVDANLQNGDGLPAEPFRTDP